MRRRHNRGKIRGTVLLWLSLCGFVALALAQSSAVYVGSKKSNKYHYTSCQWAQKTKPENKVIFKSVKEAQQAGYVR
jgi:hypothetical protein